MPNRISQEILKPTVSQPFSLTGISISFNLLYTIPVNTYICFMSFTDPVSYSNTQFMEFPSPLANNNILFTIPSAFPSLGFILALSNCIQITIMCSLCMHGRGYGEVEESCLQIYLNSCRTVKCRNSSEQKGKTTNIHFSS